MGDTKIDTSKAQTTSKLFRQASGATGSSYHSQMSQVLKGALSPRAQNKNKLAKVSTNLSSLKNSKSDVPSTTGSPVIKKSTAIQTEISRMDLDKYLLPDKELSDKLKAAEERAAKLEEQLRKSEEMRKKEFNYVKAVEEAVKINEEMISKLARRLGPEERTSFQADIIKVELNKMLNPVQSQSSVAKMLLLKNAVTALSRAASDVMSGFALYPSEVMTELTKKLQSESAFKEIADNPKLKAAAIEALQKYINEDYTEMRKSKAHGPYEFSAGNIDSARIVPGGQESPFAMNMQVTSPMKFVRSQSAYNNPLMLESDTPPEFKKKVGLPKDIQRASSPVPVIANFATHVKWLDQLNPSPRKTGDKSVDTLPTASQHTKKTEDLAAKKKLSIPRLSKKMSEANLASVKSPKERPTSTQRPSSLTKTLNSSLTKSGCFKKAA